jgi:hypothetical protein
MDVEVAEAVKDSRSVKALGNRPIKGYDEAMPVFAISLWEMSQDQTSGARRIQRLCEHHGIRSDGPPSVAN